MIKAFKYLIIIGAVLFIQGFVFQPLMINSDAMSSCLEKGDYIILNKWQTNFAENSDLEVRNQVLAFHYPLDKGEIEKKAVYVKRCVGLPGDSLLLQKGLTNDFNGALKFDYVLDDEANLIDEATLEKLQIEVRAKIMGHHWLLSLNEKDVEKIKEIDPRLNLEIILQNKDEYDESIFPSDMLHKWNRDFFGPLYIPKAQDKIHLNRNNISHYFKIIQEYEGHTLELDGATIQIDGKVATTFTFKQNYYFFMGDNRHQSIDSRYWGLVPQDHLIASCSRILFNIEKPLSKRFFKPIK